MFGRLSDLVENVAELSVDKAVLSSVVREETQDYIIQLNTIGQLLTRGINPEGELLSKIGGPYSNFTMSLGQKQSRFLINLEDTGAFYKSFDITPEKDGFIIRADTIKEGVDFRERWGEVLGLTDFSLEQLGKRMQPDIVKYTLDTLLE